MTVSGSIQDFYNANPYPLVGNYRDYLRRRVMPHLHGLQPTFILDAGCGTGNLTAELASLYPLARVVGVDFAASAIAHARGRTAGRPNVSFVVGDLNEDLGFAGAVDLLYCQGVLHHLAEPAAALKWFCRYLRPGGIALVWLYNPYGRRQISDVIAIERALLGPDAPLDARLAGVREIIEWLDPGPSLTRPLRRLRRFLGRDNWPRLLADCLARRRSSLARQQAELAEDRKYADRYLNPFCRYYTVAQANSLFSSAGFTIDRVLDFANEPLPAAVTRSPLYPLLNRDLNRWSVLEVLKRPRGLMYLLTVRTDQPRP